MSPEFATADALNRCHNAAVSVFEGNDEFLMGEEGITEGFNLKKMFRLPEFGWAVTVAGLEAAFEVTITGFGNAFSQKQQQSMPAYIPDGMQREDGCSLLGAYGI